MSQNPLAFSRSKMMLCAILEIIQAGGSALDQSMKIQALGEYKSRGKGGKFKRGKIFHTSNNVPHQGQQECARRIRSEGPVPVPRRMWSVVYEPGYRLAKTFAKRADALRAGRAASIGSGGDLNAYSAVLS